MPFDISTLLQAWPYDPTDAVRRIRGLDGKDKLQVRLPLGIEQYELDGRPDGLRPHGHDSYLDYYRAELALYRRDHGDDEGFKLNEEAMGHLRDEGVLYYFRYLICLQMADYDTVIRDTQRNMELLSFVERYAEKSEDAYGLTQYWPYLVRIQATARAMQRMDDEDRREVLRILHEAAERIRHLAAVDTPIFAHEKERSLAALKEMAEQLRANLPPTEKEVLQRRLHEAVAAENYERAARLRDIIDKMDE